MIALVNEEKADNDAQYRLRGNILHWSVLNLNASVSPGVFFLASEIYGMVNGFDLGSTSA